MYYFCPRVVYWSFWDSFVKLSRNGSLYCCPSSQLGFWKCLPTCSHTSCAPRKLVTLPVLTKDVYLFLGQGGCAYLIKSWNTINSDDFRNNIRQIYVKRIINLLYFSFHILLVIIVHCNEIIVSNKSEEKKINIKLVNNSI